MHSATLKTTIAVQSAMTATEWSSQRPAATTVRPVPAKSSPESASARSRRRPSSAFATGSCAATITSVFTKKMTPMPASLTDACSLAYGGSTVWIWA